MAKVTMAGTMGRHLQLQSPLDGCTATKKNRKMGHDGQKTNKVCKTIKDEGGCCAHTACPLGQQTGEAPVD